MYRPQYISLRDAAAVIAEQMAKTSSELGKDAPSTLNSARDQLVLALYEGVISSEGVRWELVEPDPLEPESVISEDRVPIPRRFWSNECRCETRTDELSQTITNLDGVEVNWDENAISWYELTGDLFAYYKIQIPVDQLEKAFYLLAEALTNVQMPADPMDAQEEITYSTGSQGRRSSVQIVEAEMRRRFANREQAPSMTAESKHLSQWLASAHPQAARATPKTIQNRCGALFRQLMADIPK
jgi:hypothetical protein